jgi:hypothetical protein
MMDRRHRAERRPRPSGAKIPLFSRALLKKYNCGNYFKIIGKKRGGNFCSWKPEEACFMNKFRALLVVGAVVFAGIINASNEIDLSGTVSDQDGKPLAGVEVYLSNMDPKDSTDADGKYALIGSGVHHMVRKTNDVNPVIRGNTISFNVSKAQSIVRLDILDLSGRCIRNVMRSAASVQKYSLPLPVGRLSPSIYIVSLNIGSDHFVQRMLVQQNGVLQTGKNSAGAEPGMGKKSASGSTDVLDELHFVKQKFPPVDTSITAYKGTYNITMTVEDTFPPVITIFNDSTSFAFQDSAHWRVYWNVDSFPSQRKIEDNSGLYWPVMTNTPITPGRACFVHINYEAHDPIYNFNSANRLLILYDSTVNNDATPPVLTVTPDSMRFTKGAIFKQWEGVTAKDQVDSTIVLVPEWVKITDDIKSQQQRNPPDIYMDVAGTYTITYSTMDTHKNKISKSRTLIVSEAAGD